MKTKAKLHRLFTAVSAISLMVVVFPALPQQATASQSAPKTFQQQVTVTTESSNSDVTVTTTVPCGMEKSSEPRLDYMLNSGCGDVVIGELPKLPHVAVTTQTSTSRIFVQKLPAPPQVRFVHTGQSAVAFETVAFASGYKPTIYSVRISYFSQSQNLIGRSPETKTLSELQVQRC